MYIKVSFREYKPWSGAVDTYEEIANAGKLDALEDYLEELLGESPTDTQVNDLLWFDGDTVLRDLGISDDGDEDDESDEEDEED